MYNPAIRSNFAPSAGGGDKAELVGFNDVLRFVRVSYRTVLLSMAIFAALGLVFCLLVTPTFTGVAQVLIETDHLQSFFQDAPSRPEMETETGRIESQIEVIKSDRIADAVIRKMNLLEDPEFSPPATPPFYAPVVDAVKHLFVPEVRLSEEDVKTMRTNIALERFAYRLSVRRIGQSFVAEVTVRSKDAAKAASLTNALLAAYIDADVDAKASNARRGNAWLTERLGELRAQVTTSRRAVEEFKASGEIQSLSERAVKLAELESISQSQSKLYDVFLQRFMETAQKITYPVPDARIIATASKPLTKSFPKTGLIVAFTGLLGAAAGVGLAMVRSASDHAIRSVRELGSQVDCNVLGAVTLMPRKARGVGTGTSSLLEAVSADVPGLKTFRSDLRSLKVSVNSALLTRPIKRIGVTSLRRGEGKTTIASNLAALFAVSGSRVLLVDLCESDRGLGRQLAPGVECGLADAIQHPDAMPRLLVPQKTVENLFVLPLGRVEGPASAAEQLASNRHGREIDALSETFDLLIFDLPGIEESADALAIAPFMNAIIVIVEFEKTTVEDLELALAKLAESHTEVLGVVINKSDPKRKGT